jgi:hypothetical protein
MTTTAEQLDLMQRGPLVPIKLWVPQGVKTDIQPIDTLAEIDTASFYTSVQEGIGTSLGLKPECIVQLPGTTRRLYNHYAYKLRLVFPQIAMVETTVIEVPYLLHQHERIRCRIGRDILRICTFAYNGRLNTFSLDLHVGS